MWLSLFSKHLFSSITLNCPRMMVMQLLEKYSRQQSLLMHISLTSWIMPINSEKAQLSWLRTLLRKLAAISLSWFRSSAICLWSRSDGQGSATNSKVCCSFKCMLAIIKVHIAQISIPLINYLQVKKCKILLKYTMLSTISIRHSKTDCLK